MEGKKKILGFVSIAPILAITFVAGDGDENPCAGIFPRPWPE